MNIIQNIRNGIILGAMKGADERVDGRKIGKDIIEAKLDEVLGNEKDSDKIQEGPITNFIFEILEGIWHENPAELAVNLQARAMLIRTRLEQKREADNV